MASALPKRVCSLVRRSGSDGAETISIDEPGGTEMCLGTNHPGNGGNDQRVPWNEQQEKKHATPGSIDPRKETVSNVLLMTN
jgi:hypothetical protein